MSVTLNSSVLDQLNTTEARNLHELTDKLSTCGVGKIVNLPQIIVVGEQSAGKSSVLEAISHVRFPVKGDVCTRFATEIVLRQAKQTRVDVSVRFFDKSKPSQTLQRVGFSEDDLPDIIKEAKESMGIASTGRDFSKDILRLEIEGPNMYPLTLVDLPGLYHVETENQSAGGKETVDQLVESYMRQKNSIILVVVTASNQLANHIALKKVKEHDPHRERTLGVITKPDLTVPGKSEERNYIQLARNQENAHKLNLGWHVLRNRAEDEDALDTRDAAEQRFFETTAWATIPKDDRGIASLRKKLSRVLYNHIRQNLSGVIEDIEAKLRERQEELDQLGTSRSSPEEMRSFLLNISQKFQKLVWDGIYGRYNDAFFGDLNDTDHKLRAQLRNFNRAFDYVLATKGSRLAIASDDDSDNVPAEAPAFLKIFLQKHPYDFPEPKPISKEALKVQLESRAAANQGCEFPGSHNTELIIQLFQTYASPWQAITAFHIKQVTLVAKAFIDRLFRHIVGQSDGNPTTEAILCGCVDPFFTEKEELLAEKMEELLRPYIRGYAMPMDVEFRQMVTSRTVNRLAQSLAEMSENQTSQTDAAEYKKNKRDMVERATSTLDAVDGGQFGTETVIDMMLAYYEMSRRTFTDNVINLGIESCLIQDLPHILTPTKVDKMHKDKVKELAAETEDVQARRDQLKAERDILRVGLEQCRKYKPRGVTIVPSSKSEIHPTNGQKNITDPVPLAKGPGNLVASSTLFSTNAADLPKASITQKELPLLQKPVTAPVAQGAATSTGGLFGGNQPFATSKSPQSRGIFSWNSPSTTPSGGSSSGGIVGSQSQSTPGSASSAGLFKSPPVSTSGGLFGSNSQSAALSTSPSSGGSSNLNGHSATTSKSSQSGGLFSSNSVSAGGQATSVSILFGGRSSSSPSGGGQVSQTSTASTHPVSSGSFSFGSSSADTKNAG